MAYPMVVRGPCRQGRNPLLYHAGPAEVLSEPRALQYRILRLMLTGGKYSARMAWPETWKYVPDKPERTRMTTNVRIFGARAVPSVKKNRTTMHILNDIFRPSICHHLTVSPALSTVRGGRRH